MPDPNEQIDDNENVDFSEKNKVEEQISEQLGSLVEHNEGDKKLLAELIADPDVRAIIDAKTTGRKLKLVEDNGSSGSLSDLGGVGNLDEANDDVDLDELSREDYAKVIMKKTVGLISGVISKELDVVGKDIGAIKQYVKLQEDQRVDKEIKKSRELHKDFGDFEKPMLELSKRNPGLTIKQLYTLAKSEKGDNVDRRVATERPETSSARTNSRPKRTTDLKLGRPGMDTLLDNALDKIDLSF